MGLCSIHLVPHNVRGGSASDTYGTRGYSICPSMNSLSMEVGGMDIISAGVRAII